MEKDEKTQNESEELEAEQKHLEEDIRKEIINEFGFDESEDEDRIAKAVEREMKHQKSIRSAIGQKIKYRSEYEKLKTPKTDAGKSNDNPEDLDERVAKVLEKRDLDSMEYPDELKKQIAQVAKINSISIKKAVADPYIASKIKAWEKEQGIDEASISRNNRAGKSNPNDEMTPPDVDFSTPEGRKEYDDWKNRMIKKGY
jgi:hypothetical protein